MSSRWTGFFIWALVAASTAFWGIKIFAAKLPVPSGAQAPQAIATNGPMERLFGAIVVASVAAPVQHPESERFQLVGVIAPPQGSSSQGGVAIVSIDGQPARAWHVGATLDGNVTLVAVARRTADFGPPGGPTAFSLQLPEPAAPETGTLVPAVSQGTAQPAAVPAFQQQVAPQRAETGQHVAQPGVPGVGRGGYAGPGGMPGRNGVAQPRPGFNQQGSGNLPPPRSAAPVDQNQNPNDGNPPQQ
jgi:general secretion pathway protein C